MTATEALQEVQDDITRLREKGVSVGTLTDGYHSFNELYQHRIANYIALARAHSSTFKPVWRTKMQSNGTAVPEGWFLLGINKKAGNQITYHVPISMWEQCSFASDLAKAPEYDGHTPADVLERLAKL